MPSNRSYINDLDVVRPGQVLEKGVPIPGFRGRYTVEEGWKAVITEGGMFREVLSPGYYPLDRYAYFREVKAVAVKTRIQTLDIVTTGEFVIAQPAPVQIDLSLAVEYQIVDPRRVALEVETPLTNLFDRVITAVRSVVVYATVEEIRRNGEGIATNTLQRLRAAQLSTTLGINVLNVSTTSIKATDVGNDALAALQIEQVAETMRWHGDNERTQGTQVTWPWLLRNDPETARLLIQQHGKFAEMMVQNYGYGALNRSAGDPGIGQMNPAAIGSIMYPQGLFGEISSSVWGVPSTGQQQLGVPTQADRLPSTPDIHARMREEVEYLESLPGAKVGIRSGSDARGIPDGSYDVQVLVPRNSGGRISIMFTCPAGYPDKPPIVDIEVDGQSQPFQSAIVRGWTKQYLLEITREAKRYFG